VDTAVDTLLAGRLVGVMGEVPPSRVGPAISFETMAQTNRSAGYGSGGYQQSRSGYSGSKSMHGHLRRRF